MGECRLLHVITLTPVLSTDRVAGECKGVAAGGCQTDIDSACSAQIHQLSEVFVSRIAEWEATGTCRPGCRPDSRRTESGRKRPGGSEQRAPGIRWAGVREMREPVARWLEVLHGMRRSGRDS